MNMKESINYSKATFLRCHKGVAYYALTVPYSEQLYSFPVPLKTIQDETLAAKSHTIHFMEHIHNAICQGKLIKEAA